MKRKRSKARSKKVPEARPARGLIRIYGVLLLALGLWPIGQWYLATYQDVSPWKLYGFAMYCTPHDVRIGFYDTTAGGRRPISFRGLPRELQQELIVYRRMRKGLGNLLSPEEIAGKVLAALPPRVRSLSFEIQVTRLEPSSNQLEPTTSTYRTERE